MDENIGNSHLLNMNGQVPDARVSSAGYVLQILLLSGEKEILLMPKHVGGIPII